MKTAAALRARDTVSTPDQCFQVLSRCLTSLSSGGESVTVLFSESREQARCNRSTAVQA